MSSHRLPGKMLMKIDELPLFEYVYRRCMQAGGVNKVVLATSEDRSDTVLAETAAARGFNVFRGPLKNVLKRYVTCARMENADVIIRVCGDSPFVDINLIRNLLDTFNSEDLDYASVDKNTCTEGLDSEIVSISSLEKVLSLSKAPGCYEHVTRHIRQNPHLYKMRLIDADRNLCGRNISLTVDTEDDLKVCNAIAQALFAQAGPDGFDFTTEDVARVVGELY